MKGGLIAKNTNNTKKYLFTLRNRRDQKSKEDESVR